MYIKRFKICLMLFKGISTMHTLSMLNSSKLLIKKNRYNFSCWNIRKCSDFFLQQYQEGSQQSEYASCELHVSWESSRHNRHLLVGHVPRKVSPKLYMAKPFRTGSTDIFKPVFIFKHQRHDVRGAQTLSFWSYFEVTWGNAVLQERRGCG